MCGSLLGQAHRVWPRYRGGQAHMIQLQLGGPSPGPGLPARDLLAILYHVRGEGQWPGLPAPTCWSSSPLTSSQLISPA